MADAIQRLKAYLKNTKEEILPGNLSDSPNIDYSVDRFGLAFQRTGRLGPDEIVLLRQAVRWSGMDEIRVDRPTDQPELMDQWLRNAALTWTPSGYLSAEPYTPDWLLEKPVKIDECPKKRTIDESFPAESYLHRLDFKRWLLKSTKGGCMDGLKCSGGGDQDDRPPYRLWKKPLLPVASSIHHGSDSCSGPHNSSCH